RIEPHVLRLADAAAEFDAGAIGSFHGADDLLQAAWSHDKFINIIKYLKHQNRDLTMPPSTRCAAPLTAAARGEHRNTTCAAISSGVAQRCSSEDWPGPSK